MDYSTERPDPVILAIADGNRERSNAGIRFVYSQSEHGWDVSYLSTYSLVYNETDGSYSIIPLQDAMITPEWGTEDFDGGYRSSFFDISNETGEGIVVGCRQYLDGFRTWDMYGCIIDAEVLDQEYWSMGYAYVLRDNADCRFIFAPDDNQFQGVGYPDAPGYISRRGNTAGEIIQDDITTSAFVLAGTYYSDIGGVQEIPGHTPGGIFIASRTYIASDGNRNPLEVDGVSSAQAFSLSCNPNPFRGIISLTVALDELSDVELAIYDMRGCIIDVVYSGALEKGNHLLTWNASDASGTFTAGIYYARLSVGESCMTQKLVLLGN